MKCEDRHFPSEADEIVIVPICRFAPLLCVELIPELSVDLCKKAAHVLFPPLTVCRKMSFFYRKKAYLKRESRRTKLVQNKYNYLHGNVCFVTIF